MTVLRVCYKQGVRFDEKYYYEKHIPLAGPIMGALGVKKTEIVKVSGSVPGFSAPPIRLQRAFRARLRRCNGAWRSAWARAERRAELFHGRDRRGLARRSAEAARSASTTHTDTKDTKPKRRLDLVSPLSFSCRIGATSSKPSPDSAARSGSAGTSVDCRDADHRSDRRNEGRRIGNRDSEHQMLKRRGAETRGDAAHSRADAGERQPRECDGCDGLTRSRAERQPDAELARPLGDGARDQTVETDGGQQHREASQRSKQQRLGARRGHRFAAHVIERTELRHRQQRIDRFTACCICPTMPSCGPDSRTIQLGENQVCTIVTKPFEICDTGT